jgi:threonine dehydrogenase-like Zn-dependent dehydrogenase
MLAIAAQTGSTQPRLVEVQPPRGPGDGEVLCRTLELGICGTDREILLSAKPWAPAGEERLILGHECLARVEAVGAGVTEFRPGDLVVPTVRRRIAGEGTYKNRRVDMLPFGHYTERGIVREHGFSPPLWLDRPEHLFRVPTEIADLAVLAEPLSVSEKGVNEALLLTQARLGRDAWSGAQPPRVLVSGMGPIGFTAVVAAQARGWQTTMLGRDEADTFRAQLVQRLGGRYQHIERAAAADFDVERDGYDLLLECTGSETVLVSAASLVRSCGVIVWLGSNRVPQPSTLNIQKLIRDGLLRNHLHVGCVNEAPRDFHDALKDLALLAKDRRAELAALITARVRPEESLWHYEHRRPQGIKTVLMFES